jgi:protein O-mannosyl-transferase
MKIQKKNKRPDPIPSIKNKLVVYLFLLVVVPIALNWKNISYEFTTSDDTLIITNNYSFLSDFKNVFHAFEKDNFMSMEGKNYYRPVQTISFMVDAQISGEKPHAYHFSNIFYHVLTVIVLFFLLRKFGVRDDISFFISLLFAIHPLFTNAVVWVPGRGDLLSGLFCSAAFLSFIYYNSTRNKWYFFFHSVAFIFALFSKEISVFLPVMVISYYWFILKNKYEIKALIPFFIVWSFSVFLFFLLRYIFLNSQSLLSFKAFISNLPVIPIFLSKLIIPLDLSPMPVYNITFIITGVIILIVSAIYIRKLKKEDRSLILIGAVWFLGFIIPAMFVELAFAKVRFQYLECRSYLPSIGAFIALGIFINGIFRAKGINILAGIFIPVILIFGIISYNYSGVYTDGISFFSSIIKSNRANAYAFSERGCIYLANKNIELALADFDSSIKISPALSDAYFNKAVLFNSINNHTQAELLLSQALHYDTLYPEANNLKENVYINLSSEKLTLRKFDEAKTLLKLGISKYPDNSSLHFNLGLAYYAKTRFDSALVEYNRAIKSEQHIPSYFNNRGMAEYHLNNFNNAINDFNRALDLKPDLLDAWGNRGMAKMKLNDYEGAISDFSKAIMLNKDFGAGWYFRGLAYFKLNKIIEAESNLKKANELGYKGKIYNEQN